MGLWLGLDPADCDLFKSLSGTLLLSVPCDGSFL